MSYTTRSGRTIKEPQRYEPKEKVTDDYAEDEYDEDDDDESDASDEEDSDSSDEEDADDNGNLKGFVTYSDDEEEDEDEPDAAKNNVKSPNK